MGQSGFAVVQIAQGDPTGQELGIGALDRARFQTVIGGHLIGSGYHALLQSPPRQNAALHPPQIRADLVAGGMGQKVDGLFIQIFHATPAHAVVDQAGIVSQIGGNSGDGGFWIGLAFLQSQTSLSQKTVGHIHLQQQMLGCLVLLFPQQAVHAAPIILGPQMVAEMSEELPLL